MATMGSQHLIGLSDRDLLLRAGAATHQHYKGGLYRLVGVVKNADTGDFILGGDGQPRVLYEHVHPHSREYWLRDYDEFFGDHDGHPRFRPLGKGEQP